MHRPEHLFTTTISANVSHICVICYNIYFPPNLHVAFIRLAVYNNWY